MKTNIEIINNTRKTINITFDANEVEAQKQNTINDFIKNAKVSGFRQGKAPKAMIEKLYADSIKNQLERSLTSKAIDEMNSNKDFDIYAIVDIKNEDTDGAVSLIFTADVYPEVNIPEDLSTKVELESSEVTQEEIDNGVLHNRNQLAKYEEVSRPIQKGDFVRLSYAGKIDGEPVKDLLKDMPMFADQKSTWEEAGNEQAPGIQGIVQGIVNMQKEQKATLSHEFPAEFPVQDLAGKKVDYDVEIFEVREKILPELDEEFFKNLKVDSLEDFQNKIKESIANEKKSNNEILKRQFAVEQLMDKLEFEVPESAIEDERHSILEETMTRFMSSGASKEDIEKNKEVIFENAGKEAQSRAKMRVFLNRVAKACDLKIDNEDMSRMLWQEAMRTRTKPEELIKQLKKDPSKGNRMRSDALLQKAINFIAEKAEVITKE